MPYWLKITLIVAASVAVGVVTAGAGSAIIAYAGITATSAQATLGAVTLTATAVTGIGLNEVFINNPQTQVLQNQITDLTAQVATLTATIATNNTQIANLQLQISTHQGNNQQNQDAINGLQQQVTTLLGQNETLQQQVTTHQNTIQDLQEEIEELGGKGNVKGMFLNSTYKTLYYSAKIMQKTISSSLQNKNIGFISQGNYFLKQNSQNDYSVAFMPVTSNRINSLCKQISTMLCNEYERLKPSEGFAIKIVYPYLDLVNKHWLTGEINITLVKDSVCINNYLHDPRGLGKMPDKQASVVSKKLNVCLTTLGGDKTISFNNGVSPYQSARQSLVDKISCGPIVVKECLRRFQNKDLNRTIPYQFGATELVKKQRSVLEKSGSKVLSKFSQNRYRFLRYDGLQVNKLKSKQDINRKSETLSFC